MSNKKPRTVRGILFGPAARTRTWNNSLEGYWYIPLPIGSNVYYTIEYILRQLLK